MLHMLPRPVDLQRAAASTWLHCLGTRLFELDQDTQPLPAALCALQISSEQLQLRDDTIELRNTELAAALVQLRDMQASCDQRDSQIFELQRSKAKAVEERDSWHRRFEEAIGRGRRIYEQLRMVRGGAVCGAPVVWCGGEGGRVADGVRSS
jgi:hypothetical protein